MTTPLNKKSNYIAEIIVIAGYFVMICLLTTLFGGFYYMADKAIAQPTPTQDPFLASLSAPTPTPHIPINYQAGTNSIFKDAFIDNRNSWQNEEDLTSITVEGGKLSFGSLHNGNFATARSGEPASYLNQPYYLQADLSVDQITADSIGIIFRAIPGGSNDFFVFQINLESKQYSLYHHASNFWSMRMSGNTDSIQSYPSINTLGIFVNKGYLEFYINHKIVDTYQDTGMSFQSGRTGFYVDNSGFNLIVTNFSIDKAGGQ